MAKEVFTFDFCGRNLTIETGEIAKQAGGAVVVRYQDTVVLSTATANHTPVSYTHLDVYKRQEPDQYVGRFIHRRAAAED